MAGSEAAGGVAQPFASEAGAAEARVLPGPPPGPWRLLDRLVVAGFAAALVLPAALLVARVDVAQVENRAPRTLPALSIAGLADATWPAGVDGFLTDHLWPRPYAIRLRGEVYRLSGGTGNPDVIRGVDDWLFIRQELQPRCPRTPAQQAAALERGAAAFGQRGIEFRFVLAPDKHTIYPEKLPPRNPFPPSCVDTNRAELDEAIAPLEGVAIDTTAALQAARATPGAPEVYYDQDTHWTPMGAVAALGELARSFGPGVWSAEDVQVQGRSRRVLDTPGLVGLRQVVVMPKVVIRPEVAQHRVDVPVPVTANNARTVFRITSTGSDRLLPGRTLIVYDSFFGIVTYLVAPYFEDSTWVNIQDMRNHPEIARLLGPFDRVIVECVGRGFYETDFDAILTPAYEPAAG
jgi:alginate O-acetyltransferase complex protein AlgJ